MVSAILFFTFDLISSSNAAGDWVRSCKVVESDTLERVFEFFVFSFAFESNKFNLAHNQLI